MSDEEEKAILAAMAKDGPSSLLTCRLALKETLRDLEEERESVRLAQEATKRQAELRAAAESEVSRLRGLLGKAADWIGDTCDVIGMSDTRHNAGLVLFYRLAAALAQAAERRTDHG